MRRIGFYVSADIDDGIVELESRRRGRPFAETLDEISADIECRLSDAIRWRDGVTAVGVRVQQRPRLELVQ